jgi:hypothetical protein
MTFRVLFIVITALLAAATTLTDTFVTASVAAKKRIAFYRLDHKKGEFG